MKITMEIDGQEAVLCASNGAVGVLLSDAHPMTWLTPADAEALQLVLSLTIETAKAQAAVRGAG